MSGDLSIEVEDVGMNNSIPEEVEKDEMDLLKEEEIWRSRMERMKNALAAVRTMAQQDPTEVNAVACTLVGVIKGADVEEFISMIERLADQTNLSAVLNALGPWNLSLLHCATSESKDEILRLLLNFVGDHLITVQNDWGNTPLHIAAMLGRSRAAKMLIHRVKDLPNDEDKKLLRKRNKLGNTALHEAVLNSHVEMVHYLLNKDLELVYFENKGQKSPLYLALDTDDPAIHKVLFSLSLEPSRIEGLPPIHGAIMRSNYDLAAQILKKNVKLFAMTDSKGGNVFHLAAYMNRPEVFKLLGPETEYLAQQQDRNGNGDLPIHIASKMGYVKLIKKLERVSQRPNGQGQTALHVAAKYGRASVVKYILRHPELGNQINAIDHDGNTALHLAAMHSQPTALIPLLLDKRSEPAIPNNKCLTAVDIARDCVARGYTIRKHLASLVLACSCTKKVDDVSGDSLILRPEAREKEFGLVCSRKKTSDWEIVKDFINSRMVVATLVATVTFAAGFAVPGGFNGSDMASKDDRGMATMLDNRMFQAFAICNTIAMFCSMTVVVNLIWARLNDADIAVTAYERTTLPLRIALSAMSIAFLTGVTLTVGKLPWLANTIFYLGLVFLIIISGAKYLEYPPAFGRHSRPVRRLIYWLILAYIRLWRVETCLYDDAEDDGTASKTLVSQPEDGARQPKPMLQQHRHAGTRLHDDAKDDGTASKTLVSRPEDGAHQPKPIFLRQTLAGMRRNV